MHHISIYSFISVYILLIIVTLLMKKAKIKRAQELLYGSAMMTVQLLLAGYILTELFENPYPVFTCLYLAIMFIFAGRRILSKKFSFIMPFKFSVACAFVLTNILITVFFVIVITEQSFFSPQYTIPITGMLLGNTITGYNLALKTFQERLHTYKEQNHSLLHLGVHPKKILLPHINAAFETALLPTINNMLNMGIITLPGMLTGQILAGASPNTAILYQITITIAICATVSISVFCGLYVGQHFLYNGRLQLLISESS